MVNEKSTTKAPRDLNVVTLRPLAEQPDYAGLAAAVNASLAADNIERTTTAEELEVFYRNLADFNPAHDSILAWHAGQVVGEAYLIRMREDSGRRIYFHHTYLRPEWRQPELISVMTGRTVERAVALHMADGAGQDAILRTSASEAELAYLAEIEQRGYTPERYFYHMVRPDLEDLPTFPCPDGIELRPVLDEHLRAIWEAKEEAFRDHWGHRQPSEQDYQLFLQDPIQDHSHWVVAWDGDEIAGMVLNFIDEEENRQWDRRRGYTEDISVRRPWRRRGLATFMIAVSLRRLRALGMTEAALGVDADNLSGALGLYQRLGYQVVRRSTSYARPVQQGHL